MRDKLYRQIAHRQIISLAESNARLMIENAELRRKLSLVKEGAKKCLHLSQASVHPTQKSPSLEKPQEQTKNEKDDPSSERRDGC